MTYGQCTLSSGWHDVSWTLYHPDDLAILCISSGSDDLWPMQDVIRMTYDLALCHPDEITNVTEHIEAETNGCHFANDIFKCIFLNENVWISIKISLKFVPQGPINNIPALVQIMAWRRPGDKPLSEPMVVSLPTHICVARPQWINYSQYLIRMAYGHCRMSSGWLTMLHYVIRMR